MKNYFSFFLIFLSAFSRMEWKTCRLDSLINLENGMEKALRFQLNVCEREKENALLSCERWWVMKDEKPHYRDICVDLIHFWSK